MPTEQFKLLEYVVKEEDYATGSAPAESPAHRRTKSHVMFGRNEGGGHRFHGWVDKLLETDDDQLNGLFAQGERWSV